MEKTTTEPSADLEKEFDEVLAHHQGDVNLRSKAIALMVLHRTAILAVGKLPSYYTVGLDFDNPTRNETIALMKVFGGTWRKSVCNGLNDRINYSQEIDGVTVRLWASPPPPSCTVIEEQVLVPATPEHWTTKRVLRCKDEEGTNE